MSGAMLHFVALALLFPFSVSLAQQNHLDPSAPVTVFQGPILIEAPEAERTRPAALPCPDIDNFQVDPSTLMPHGGIYKPVFSFRANGFRNYSCNFPGPIFQLPGTARASFSGDFVGTGGYNADGLPELLLAIPGTNEPAGRILADKYPVIFEGLGDDVKWWRRTMVAISGQHVPWVAFGTMNETEGGARPTAEQCAGRTWFESPFSALYTYWTC